MKYLNNIFRLHFKQDLFVLTFIIAIPFLFFLYNIAPKNTQIWKTSWFMIDSKIFEDPNSMFWHYSVKILTISILSIWFVTCKYWWRFAIFVPIVVEFYKFIGLFEVYFLPIKFHHNLNSLSFSVAYIILLLFISKRLGYYSKTKSLSSELNIEISELMTKVSKINKKEYRAIKEKLIDLRSKKESMDKKEYLTKLIALQDSLVD
jgi:hypothetical protein